MDSRIKPISPQNETELEIKKLNDDELARKFMYSDRDRKTDPDAERVYWLCVYEINRRIDNGNE